MNEDNDIPVIAFSNNDDELNVLLKRVSEINKTRTVISSGKRPNPSDLGS